ncbi:hypothetical protein QFC22_005803 [Naganishia vaughanmartiniae]|uniref:Uncharacterized protein n=1 Tax=Naganishia vaughanmartiniae TaxID=1424756 RepID=A0ACC2WS29_9TREE|nr:hypothetical protein QFC22_005803 [Naganishia vaughanmartiniae]
MALVPCTFARLTPSQALSFAKRSMSTSKCTPRVVLLTGGSWWGSSSPENVGHHFIQQVFRNIHSEDRPLKIYICTRAAPPEGELTRFVKRQNSSQSQGNLDALDPHSTSLDVSLHHLPLNLLNPNSIRNCASEFLSQESRLDVLVLNAAIAPNKRESSGLIIPQRRGGESDESSPEELELETGMMTNVVGSAMLTKLLEPALLKAEISENEVEKPRIVLVSSELHRRLGDLEITPQSVQKLTSPVGWKGMQTYKLTKLIQTIWLYAMQREYKDRIDCVAVSPGFIPSTSLSRASSFSARLFMSYVLHFMPFASTPEEGGRKVYQGAFGDPSEWKGTSRHNGAVYLKNGEAVEPDHRVLDEALGSRWKAWIDNAIATITAPIAALVSPAPNVLIVGGTAGIGAALAQKLAHELPPSAHITFVGRNSSAAATIIASIRQQTSGASGRGTGPVAGIEFAQVDCGRMSDVKRFCEQYSGKLKASGRHLDILILTAGKLSMKGRTLAAPGSKIDAKMAMHFYSRMLFIRQLKTFFVPQSIVMSVLDGKHSDAHSKRIYWDDLGLAKPGHYGLRSAATHCQSMTDIMMQGFASARDPISDDAHAVSLIHAYPGFVATGVLRRMDGPLLVRLALAGLSKLFASSPETCAERLIEGMVQCHRSTLTNVHTEGNTGETTGAGLIQWYNLDQTKIIPKQSVEQKLIEQVQAHTWQVVDAELEMSL